MPARCCGAQLNAHQAARACPMVQASQPPPTSWRVQFGDSPWLELAADASTLEMTSTAFLQLLLADPLLGPAAKSLQPPLALWHLVVIQRILSDSRRTPTKDDDVDDNVAVITCDDTVGEAAATRQTGTKVFIRARPPVVAPIAGERRQLLVAACGLSATCACCTYVLSRVLACRQSRSERRERWCHRRRRQWWCRRRRRHWRCPQQWRRCTGEGDR